MQNRLLALDIFRGLTIFLMIVVNTPGSWEYVYPPLRHAAWDGLTPTDLVFPFFVFIVGVAMSYSFNKYDGTDRAVWVRKIITRTIKIFLVGVLLNWFPMVTIPLSELRIFGVLQRIALAYGFGSLIVVFLDKKWLPAVFSVILVAYYLILITFGGENPLSLEGNASGMLDLWLIGENHVYKGYGIPFDPEGLLSTLPTIATVLFGYWIGKIVQKESSIRATMEALFPYGVAAIVLALAANYLGCPINKPIWSSSYVLVTGGLATLTLILLLWILDEKGWTGWSYPFRAFGLNPLISYVLSGVIVSSLGFIRIGDQGIYSWLYTNVFQSLIGNMSGSFVQAIVYTLFIWLFAHWMYKKNIVVKL